MLLELEKHNIELAVFGRLFRKWRTIFVRLGRRTDRILTVLRFLWIAVFRRPFRKWSNINTDNYCFYWIFQKTGAILFIRIRKNRILTFVHLFRLFLLDFSETWRNIWCLQFIFLIRNQRISISILKQKLIFICLLKKCCWFFLDLEKRDVAYV